MDTKRFREGNSFGFDERWDGCVYCLFVCYYFVALDRSNFLAKLSLEIQRYLYTQEVSIV